MSDERPTTSLSSVLPGGVYSAVAYLSPMLPSRLSSGLTSTARPISGREVVYKVESSHAADTEQLTASPNSKATVSRGGPEHTQHYQMAFNERLKTVFRSIVPSKENCIACDKHVRSTKLTTAPCQHKYCHRCIRRMGEIALENKELFPVRCCNQEIPVKRVAMNMEIYKKKLYTSRSAEDAVPPAERWYCPHTTCGKWIPPRYLKPGAKAQKCCHCRATICSQCRDLAHEKRECSKDPGLEAVLEVARHRRWQRCHNCHAIVSKRAGCNHIKCICGAEFCYICGGPRGCNCRQTVEILDHVHQIEEDENLAITIVAMEMAERQENEIQHDENTAEARQERQAQRTRREFEDVALMDTAMEMAAWQEAGNERARLRNWGFVRSPLQSPDQQSPAQDLQSPRSPRSQSRRLVRPDRLTLPTGQPRTGREERPERPALSPRLTRQPLLLAMDSNTTASARPSAATQPSTPSVSDPPVNDTTGSAAVHSTRFYARQQLLNGSGDISSRRKQLGRNS